MNKQMAIVLGVVILGSMEARAQVNLNERVAQFSALGKSDAEYRLGPGDLIEIAVFGVDDFKQVVRISASGIVKLPLVEPIEAAGLTPAEFEQRLASLLQGEVIKDPQVSVFVREYRSQPVYILGAVRSPGQYQITLQLKIVDILSMAGGLTGSAVDEAVIQRKGGANGATDLIKVDLKQLLEKGDLALNIPVRGGDVIHIQEHLPQTIYVIGEVNRAGAFQLPPKQDMRVSQAFAWAGGPMKTAKLDAGILVRYSEKGTREELSVNFQDILKGKTEDFLVQANDIIFVPGSKFKNLGYSLLNIMPGTISNIPYMIP